jgi:hypothetical protein
MTDMQELRRHIRVLEDQVEYDSGIGERLDEIEAKLDALYESQTAIVDRLKEMIEAINANAAVLRDTNDVMRDMCTTIRETIAACARPAANPAASPFTEVFDELAGKPAPKPKRPKLKIVPPDQPKPPDGAA